MNCIPSVVYAPTLRSHPPRYERVQLRLNPFSSCPSLSVAQCATLLAVKHRRGTLWVSKTVLLHFAICPSHRLLPRNQKNLDASDSYHQHPIIVWQGLDTPLPQGVGWGYYPPIHCHKSARVSPFCSSSISSMLHSSDSYYHNTVITSV